MSGFMDVNTWMIVGFLLAAYAVVANDSLQTLGTYISSNKTRSPKGVQMLFICTITVAVLMLGWFLKTVIRPGVDSVFPVESFRFLNPSPGSTSFLPLPCWL